MDNTIYTLKASECFFAIAIHAILPIVFLGGGAHLDGFAVPFFFFVSGYHIELNKKVIRKIKSIAYLLSVGFGIYVSTNLYNFIFKLSYISAMSRACVHILALLYIRNDCFMVAIMFFITMGVSIVICEFFHCIIVYSVVFLSLLGIIHLFITL